MDFRRYLKNDESWVGGGEAWLTGWQCEMEARKTRMAKTMRKEMKESSQDGFPRLSPSSI